MGLSVNVSQCRVLSGNNCATASAITTYPCRSTFNAVTVEVSLTGLLSGQFSHLRGHTVRIKIVDNVGQLSVAVHGVVRIYTIGELSRLLTISVSTVSET